MNGENEVECFKMLYFLKIVSDFIYVNNNLLLELKLVIKKLESFYDIKI